MKNPSTRQGGFTLMEMMIALIIGAVIVTPFYFITRGMANQTTKQQMETEAMQRARMGMSVLANDFARIGLSASPNPAIDRKSMAPANSTALHRRAIVQLSRGDSQPDALLLTGNFLGAKIYQSLAGGNEITIKDPISNAEECRHQFDPLYSYAHIVGPTGDTLDARIEGVNHSGTLCTLTLAQGDLTDEGFTTGDTIYVSANQTLLYRTEQVAEVVDLGGGESCNRVNQQLVKYLVRFDGSNTAADCSRTVLPNTSEIITSTRTVVVDHVQDFQVWFRPVDAIDEANGQRRLDLHAYTVGNLASVNPPSDFFPDNQTYILPASIGGASNVDDLSCADNYAYGPEHMRSAIIRLTVRSEKPDNTVEYSGFAEGDAGVGRLVRYSLTDELQGDCPERAGAAYKLSTVVTEVAMPNLAARSDMIM
jgi:prepilin-type N-terminal cleavage/methylation domain-containing protein